ncbi:MAG TPA: hypothetical protein VF168_04460 [Trueperaceae bacterium]
MNDRVAEAGSAALTHEEAIQVLSLSPDGLRRLADLDEAIMELRAARRSLLANRLESLKDAFAAARNGRSDDGGAPSSSEDPAPGSPEARSNHDPLQPLPDATAGSRVQEEEPLFSGHAGWRRASENPEGGPVAPFGKPAGANGAFEPVASSGEAGASASLRIDIDLLRNEVAELRRELASLRVPGHDLEQIQRRLSYLEAEIESRHL